MALSNWFGDLNLGAKYALGLGGLMFLVITFAFIQLLRHKRRVRKHAAALQAKSTDKEARMEQIGLTHHQEMEGDLFGIRALERGFTGGVAQSRPVSPSLTSVSTTTLHIPYGRNPSKSTLTTSIALDLGGVSAGSSSSKLLSSKGKAPSTAVDMSMEVPDSPRLGGHTHSRSMSSGPYRFYNPGASCSSLTLDRAYHGRNNSNSPERSIPSSRASPERQMISSRSSPTDRSTIGQAVTTADNSPELAPQMPRNSPPDHKDVSHLGESINQTSVNTYEPRGRRRTKSISRASFGEFYDSYYEPRESMPPLPGTDERLEDRKRESQYRYSRMPSRALV